MPLRLTRRQARLLTALFVAASLSCGEAIEPPTASEPASALDVEPVSGLAFRQVSAGFSHTCGVTTESVAYCWGANGLGRAGQRHDSQSLAAGAGPGRAHLPPDQCR